MGSSLRISSCSRLQCSCSLLAPSLVALLGALLCTRKNVLTNQGRTVGEFRSHLLQLLMNSNVTMSRFLLLNLCLNKDALMYLNRSVILTMSKNATLDMRMTVTFVMKKCAKVYRNLFKRSGRNKSATPDMSSNARP